MKTHRTQLILILCVLFSLVAIHVATGADTSPVIFPLAVGYMAARFFLLRKKIVKQLVLGRETPGGLEFAPVWLSSAEHLNRFDRTVSRANWAQRVAGRYPLPENMPHLVLQSNWARCMPIVFTSMGRLCISRDSLRFEAMPADPSLSDTVAYRNLDTELTFELPFEALKRVEIMNHASQYGAAFGLDWIRLVGETQEGRFDILLAMAGVGPTSASSNANTRVLFEAVSGRVPPGTGR